MYDAPLIRRPALSAIIVSAVTAASQPAEPPVTTPEVAYNRHLRLGFSQLTHLYKAAVRGCYPWDVSGVFAINLTNFTEGCAMNDPMVGCQALATPNGTAPRLCLW